MFKRKNSFFKKKNNNKGKILKYILLLSGLAIFLLSTLIFTPIGNIEKIYISQNSNIKDSQKFKNILLTLKGKKLLLIKAEQIDKFIYENIPNLKDVKVRKKLPNKLYINFNSYNNKYILNDQFILDETGTIISQNENEIELKNLYIDSETQFKILDKILNKEQVETIDNTVKIFEEKINLEVISVKYLSKAREIHIKTPNGSTIWIDANKDLSKQIMKLKNAIPKIDPKNQFYYHIDLRIEAKNAQKIFYKPL